MDRTSYMPYNRVKIPSKISTGSYWTLCQRRGEERGNQGWIGSWELGIMIPYHLIPPTRHTFYLQPPIVTC